MGIENIHIKQLLVLKTLLETSNVSRTAEIMKTSQSTISHILKKLRAELNDELFIISGRNICPTLKALNMKRHLDDAVGVLNSCELDTPSFKPEKCKYTFIVFLNKSSEYYLTTKLLELLSKYKNMSLKLYSIEKKHEIEQLLEVLSPDTIIGFDFSIKNCTAIEIDTLEYKILHHRTINITNKNIFKLPHLQITENNDFYSHYSNKFSPTLHISQLSTAIELIRSHKFITVLPPESYNETYIKDNGVTMSNLPLNFKLKNKKIFLPSDKSCSVEATWLYEQLIDILNSKA
jgi:DNA-binding transcriptional LysR family regulator